MFADSGDTLVHLCCTSLTLRKFNNWKLEVHSEVEKHPALRVPPGGNQVDGLHEQISRAGMS